MVIEGNFTLRAPIDKVFEFILKPDTILSCLPGAESVVQKDEKTYECVVKQKVGPISVKFKFTSVLTKVEPPTHIEMEGEGEDVTKLGHFKQKSTVDLKDKGNGEVEVSYRTDVNIVGKLAMFGDRIMRAKAKDVEKDFTTKLQEKLKAIA